MFVIWFDGTWCEFTELFTTHRGRDNNYVVAHSVRSAIDFLDVLLGLTPNATVH